MSDDDGRKAREAYDEATRAAREVYDAMVKPSREAFNEATEPFYRTHYIDMANTFADMLELP